MKTIDLRIWGVVQGVGFRPFMAKLARKLKLKGWVLNEGGYVSARLTGEAEQVEVFLRDLVEKKPEPSEIVHLEWEERELECFESFHIKDSGHGNDGMVMLPADLSVCGACTAELSDPKDPRYRHPFISCMECGPRYSIIDRVPYDRHNTAMVDFPMCDFCKKEYTDHQDRRYHAQTVSCNDCGPYVKYRAEHDMSELETSNDEALEAAIRKLTTGGIVGMKGIGGFHLAARPDLDETVRRLRELKGREEKPFAVMFGSLSELKRFCVTNKIEEQLLTGKEKPIVLLELSEEGRRFFSCEVSRSSRLLGAFLPYTSMQMLILEKTGPLIMTSANLSDQPIITNEGEMEALWERGLSGLLYHDRDIRTGEDDSVARVVDGRIILSRRARGYVPIPLYVEGLKTPGESITCGTTIFAAGGELKNTFALTKGPFVYLSQHLGDLSDFAVGETFGKNLERMKEMLRITPAAVACDSHPGYFGSKFAKDYGSENRLPVLEIQHHHSHIASVMAEHGLKGKVLGIAFDGTGYGSDGKIWGGEFLLCEGAEFNRFAHLEYTRMVGGDSASKECWKSAFSYGHSCGIEKEQILHPKFSQGTREWDLIGGALKMGINYIDSSSMGRLFDAVSYLLGACDVSLYEGDGPIRLENLAEDYVTGTEENELRETKPFCWSLDKEPGGSLSIHVGELLKEVVKERRQGTSLSELAWRFHYTVVDVCCKVAVLARLKEGVDTVALSGGVFQNRLLLEWTMDLLRKDGFRVYTNEKVPANDGGIALGQAYIGGLKFGLMEQNQ